MRTPQEVVRLFGPSRRVYKTLEGAWCGMMRFDLPYLLYKPYEGVWLYDRLEEDWPPSTPRWLSCSSTVSLRDGKTGESLIMFPRLSLQETQLIVRGIHLMMDCEPKPERSTVVDESV